ncbi:MAG: MBL fold metallo-hydrolase [Chitinispirillaceae bacterium]|jgi:glyoxylase-like metal-dependent hydrolase (beta-lactamase superfamily II)|nr:MBL fold metallo-hydrolase [Chitinispirillaceae bacterium]
MITVTRFMTGPLETNTYVVADKENRCLVIDPSIGCEEIIAMVSRESMTVEAVLLTHAHFDHIMGIPELHRQLGALPVYLHPKDAPFLTSPELNGSLFLGEKYDFWGETRDLVEGVMAIGSFSVTVLVVPGHTPGGCALVLNQCCFCGDAVFAGSIGRSDLPGGDGDQLVDAIRKKILVLPDSTILYPGHGGRTTVAREKRSNPFLI